MGFVLGAQEVLHGGILGFGWFDGMIHKVASGVLKGSIGWSKTAFMQGL